MDTMSSGFLKSSSQISTDFICDNCHVTMNQIHWIQCNKCHTFDLCNECGAPGYELLPITHENHKKYHQSHHLNDPIPSKDLQSISVEEAEKFADKDRDARTEKEFQDIMNAKKIQNDYDMSIVIDMLNKKWATSKEMPPSELYSMILGYHTQAYETDIRVLSLDGGGIRGYMPIQVLCKLITEQHLADIKEFDPDNSEHRERFIKAQIDFKNRFHYIAGTSTGGLIAFCLAVNHDIIDIKKIYAKSDHYFKKNLFGPYLQAKYDPVYIHDQIEKIIGTIKLNGKKLDAKNATLLDIHNFLNPDDMITADMLTDEKSSETLLSHGNWLEFIDGSSKNDPITIDQNRIRSRIKREKVLLITAYNTTADSITIFNTSYSKHWPYLIADVLKATMAAPTYFPPHPAYQSVIHNGHYVQDKTVNDTLSPEIFIDGGVFANDPELAALWAIRMQWKKLVNYYLLSIGTGCYNTKLNPSTWGGITGWIINDGGGVLINTLMDATRSMTEIFANNLAKFNDMKRMKFNYKLAESMNLDDPHFVEKFDEEWKTLQKGDDYKALIYFYKNISLRRNKQ